MTEHNVFARAFKNVSLTDFSFAFGCPSFGSKLGNLCQHSSFCVARSYSLASELDIPEDAFLYDYCCLGEPLRLSVPWLDEVISYHESTAHCRCQGATNSMALSASPSTGYSPFDLHPFPFDLS